MASWSVIISSESRLDRTWQALRREGRTALVPYLTAGHPTIALSGEALRVAAEHADILEVGVPFSDPLADGPTIQAATFRALANGMTLPRTLELIDSAAPAVPVVLFSYLNPVLQYGIERLVKDATSLGIAGLLLTDLPAGADDRIERTVLDAPLDLIRLVAPTSREARVREAVREAQGFVYLVARLGVTGVSSELATGLAASVAMVRRQTTLPIAVGFGISTAQQAREVAALADGVVVGSALVQALESDGVEAMASLLDTLRHAVDTPR
jgi:tryptophan synthase alpha chain